MRGQLISLASARLAARSGRPEPGSCATSRTARARSAGDGGHGPDGARRLQRLAGWVETMGRPCSAQASSEPRRATRRRRTAAARRRRPADRPTTRPAAASPCAARAGRAPSSAAARRAAVVAVGRVAGADFAAEQQQPSARSVCAETSSNASSSVSSPLLAFSRPKYTTARSSGLQPELRAKRVRGRTRAGGDTARWRRSAPG